MFLLFVARSVGETAGMFGVEENDINLVGTTGSYRHKEEEIYVYLPCKYIAAFDDKITAEQVAAQLENCTDADSFSNEVERLQKRQVKMEAEVLSYGDLLNRLSSLSPKQLESKVLIVGQNDDFLPAAFRIADGDMNDIENGAPYFEVIGNDDDEEDTRTSRDW